MRIRRVLAVVLVLVVLEEGGKTDNEEDKPKKRGLDFGGQREVIYPALWLLSIYHVGTIEP